MQSPTYKKKTKTLSPHSCFWAGLKDKSNEPVKRKSLCCVLRNEETQFTKEFPKFKFIGLRFNLNLLEWSVLRTFASLSILCLQSYIYPKNIKIRYSNTHNTILGFSRIIFKVALISYSRSYIKISYGLNFLKGLFHFEGHSLFFRKI